MHVWKIYLCVLMFMFSAGKDEGYMHKRRHRHTLGPVNVLYASWFWFSSRAAARTSIEAEQSKEIVKTVQRPVTLYEHFHI